MILNSGWVRCAAYPVQFTLYSLRCTVCAVQYIMSRFIKSTNNVFLIKRFVIWIYTEVCGHRLHTIANFGISHVYILRYDILSEHSKPADLQRCGIMKRSVVYEFSLVRCVLCSVTNNDEALQCIENCNYM